ncbi:hypothetical protein ACFQZI_14915 [Mucilaginibacter lutimaris]|uniref:Fibronectin type-III domain-containing protein n=1 Tax=Mucilaginibacter lutimaris TaxID=931629 RepID=A0ABW2ZJ00_9SPHI
MKRPDLLIVLILFSLLMLQVSCKDFIEPSIENRRVFLEAPSDKYQSKVYKIGFWWDEVEDALTYRLQVVTPGFDSPDRLVLDTLVKGNQFNFNFDPGKYEWRVRAENGSTVTPYAGARKFEVLSSSITQQAVELSAPGNGLLTNSESQNFQWGTLYGATKYHLQIDTSNFVSQSALVYDQSLAGNVFTYTLPKDQVYQWRVRAENDTAQARWSAVYRFTLDRTPPERAKAISPSDNQQVAKPVQLEWAKITSAIRYRLYVLKSDSVSNYNGSFPVMVTGNSYAFQTGNSGERIYWKVSAIDAAGNAGPASAARSFTIQ